MGKKISKALSIVLTLAVLVSMPFSRVVTYAATLEPVVTLYADPDNEDFVCGQSNTQIFTVSIENFIPDCDWGIVFFTDEACTKQLATDVPPGCNYSMYSEDPSYNPLNINIIAKNSGSELKGGTYYIKGYFWDVYGTGKFYYSDETCTLVIQKADQDGPETEDFTTVNETWDNVTSGNSDGSISGLTTDMEVSSDGGTNWTKATAATLGNLSAGTYKIRNAETDTKKASPACEVEVKASYKVTNFSNTKGSVSAANAYYEAGKTVALTTIAEEDYFFESVSYTDKDGTHVITPDKGSYSFVMPASAVTLSATLVTHDHDWTYEANGATLTAVCGGIGDCDATDTELTIQAPELTTYGGNESAEATLSAESLAGQSALPVIYYAKKNAGGNYEELQAAPTAAGDYKAYITVAGKGVDVTAFVEYTIAQKTINVKADDKTSAAGADLEKLTYKADELVGNDTFTGALATNVNKNVAGKYDIIQGSLTAGDNYSIVFTNGTYEVTATKSVETGDTDNPVVYVMIMLAALGGSISVVTINKKRRA